MNPGEDEIAADPQMKAACLLLNPSLSRGGPMLGRDLTRKEEETARRLLSYLLRHPEARDTIEGMTRWWLLEEEIHERLTEISQGLSSLVRQGLILEEQRGASLPLYRLNPDRKEEVKRLVERLLHPVQREV